LASITHQIQPAKFTSICALPHHYLYWQASPVEFNPPNSLPLPHAHCHTTICIGKHRLLNSTRQIHFHFHMRTATPLAHLSNEVLARLGACRMAQRAHPQAPRQHASYVANFGDAVPLGEARHM